MESKNKKITAVAVFLDNRKTRTYVGRLDKTKTGYLFSYDDKYLYSDKSISLGPDLPLTNKEHDSKGLFPFFKDRIPVKDNPAYKEYCQKFKISEDETDPFILLTTIGRRGPSSFIFEPSYEGKFSAAEMKLFRKNLGLTVRQFAALFDFSFATVQNIEANKGSGRDVLKRIEIYKQFPKVALFEVLRNSSKVHEDIKERVEKHLIDSTGLPNGWKNVYLELARYYNDPEKAHKKVIELIPQAKFNLKDTVHLIKPEVKEHFGRQVFTISGFDFSPEEQLLRYSVSELPNQLFNAESLEKI